jgi:hypothetical protein
MAPRDPRKTARNKMIETMKGELRPIVDQVLEETGIDNEQSLNAIIGNKTDYVIDLKNAVINSPEHYVLLWTEGFKSILDKGREPSFTWLFKKVKQSPTLKQYLDTFLRRSYLKHYDELHKRRPEVEEAEIWIGHNNADWGLLVAPRFAKGQWENDKSEIRHFKPQYWTIGHVLKTGLVVPDKNRIRTFSDVEDYLGFFEDVLVRATASPHQRAIAALYSDFVRQAERQEDVPLLIPEYRYDGRETKHKYRLDFCVIDANTMDKVGFELSPWSTHGKLATKGKSAKEINAEALANFEKEMAKLKSFFRKHGIYALIYTDTDLTKPAKIFADIQTYLEPRLPAKQLSFHLIAEFFK